MGRFSFWGRAQSLFLILVLVAICFCTCWGDQSPPKPTSVGFTVSKDAVSVTYINDGKNYGLSVGAPIWKQGLLHSDALLIFEPTDKSQLAAGWAVGYDIKLKAGKDVTFTPLVGVLTDITKGYDGRDTRAFYGFSVSIKFKL
jgi:hypothetical protein